MFDELKDIDTSAIEELVTIKNEQELLGNRLSEMMKKKGMVTGEVFDRVRLDYQSRNEALEDQARPLKEQARAEYARLRSLHGQCMHALEAARLDKEELEFRHELGEYEEDDFASQLEECTKRLEERGAELAEAEKMMESFVQAFHSKEELEAPLVDEAAADAPGADEEGVPEEPPFGEPPVEGPPVEEPPVEEPPVEEPPVEEPPVEEPPETEDAVEGGPAAESAAADEPPPGEPLPDSAPPGPEGYAGSTSALERPGQPEGESQSPLDGATMVAGGPRLVARTEDGRTQDYTLGVGQQTIGRSPENSIHLADESVSRKHAEIVFDADGYLLRDLGSGNGTFVNGERISEHRIINGDEISIGAVPLVFREQ